MMYIPYLALPAKPALLADQQDTVMAMRSRLRFRGAVEAPSHAEFLNELLRSLSESGADLLAAIDERHPVLPKLQLLVAGNYVLSAGSRNKNDSFLRVLVPLLFVLGHSFLAATPMKPRVNLILGTASDHLTELVVQVLTHTTEALDHGSLTDPLFTPSHRQTSEPFVPLSFAQIFGPLIGYLSLYFKRYPNALREPNMQRALEITGQLIDRWATMFTAGQLMTIETQFAIDIIQTNFRRMQASTSSNLDDMLAAARLKATERQELAHLAGSAEGQWTNDQLMAPAQTHDNDPPNFRRIKIIPTVAEIMSGAPPTLPGNLMWEPSAHWLPCGMERLLDTHFRLLREDLVGEVNSGLRIFLHAANNKVPPNKSGRWKGSDPRTGQSADLSVYTHVTVGALGPLARYGTCLAVEFALPDRALAAGGYAKFWDNCLMRDNLVGVVYRATVNDPWTVVLAVVADRDDTRKSKASPSGRGVIKLSFGSTSAIPAALFQFHHERDKTPYVFLVEKRGLLFEAYRPVLKALQAKDELPFVDVLCPATAPTASTPAALPLYARVPNFAFNLSFLSKNPDTHIRYSPTSTNRAELEQQLVAETTLDVTQARALLGALGSEVACIQGPPGTGKSFIGVKIVQALINLNQFPILIMCYTNHALDQFLEDLLDVDIKSIARLGSRPSERLEPYRPERWGSRNFFESLKGAEKELERLVAHQQEALQFEMSSLSFKVGSNLLWRHFPHVARSIHSADLPDKGSWFDMWLNCIDLQVEAPWKKSGKGKKKNRYEALQPTEEVPEIMAALAQFDAMQLGDSDDDGAQPAPGDLETFLKAVLEEPLSRDQKVFLRRRALELQPDHDDEALLAIKDVWQLKPQERQRLAELMRERIKEEQELDKLQLESDIQRTMNEIQAMRDQRDIEAIRQKRIIGLTTTGAAKSQHIIEALRPKIIIVEEAGETLEAHILAALHPGVQQLIMIGDHKQLRPKLVEHNLSVTSRAGKAYRLDVSLFERLIVSESKAVPPRLPHDVLLAQRRMKPTISQFIRRTGSYPELEDGEGTSGRDPIMGTAHDVFWWTHEHPQDSVSEDYGGQSHSNKAEADMAIALVEHFIHQGYKPSNIVVLTPYVGQLLKLRALMANRKLVVEVGEEDQKAVDIVLDGQDEAFTTTNLGRAVRVSSVDSFQGNERDIVIVSLVRSTFPDGSDRGIGFVGIENRIVVLLSRARMGMYLIGNEALIGAKSPMWGNVSKIMAQQGRIGPELEVVCARHPDYRPRVRDAATLRLVSPDGGCLEQCGARMPCGHACSRACHGDDHQHKMFQCTRSCSRLRDTCKHPCVKRCCDPCGNCMEPVDPVSLPGCGHEYKPRCYELINVAAIQCPTKVQKPRYCGHTVTIACSVDPNSNPCPSQCQKKLECGHPCITNCSICTRRDFNNVAIVDHPACTTKCTHFLQCKHSCDAMCKNHVDGKCPPCQKPCDATKCEHAVCRKVCSEPCVPCLEECSWSCPHGAGSCDLPCGAPCIRVPCDKRCDRMLTCGHQCPSLCGEPCPSKAFCRECGDESVLSQQVDLVMLTSYGETDVQESPVIVLGCGHVFTVETLDGMFKLESYYRRLGSAWIVPSELPDDEETKKIIVCPNCRRNVLAHETRRYSRPLKRATLVLGDKHMVKRVAKLLMNLESEITNYAVSASITRRLLVGEGPAIMKRLNALQKELRENPSRQLYDACFAAARDSPRLMRGLDKTVFCREYMVEEGKVSLLAARLLHAQYKWSGQTGTSSANKLFINAQNKLSAAIGCFRNAVAPARIAEALLERLALFRTALDQRSQAEKAMLMKDAAEDIAKFRKATEELVEKGLAVVQEAITAQAEAEVFLYDTEILEQQKYFQEALDAIKNGATPAQIEFSRTVLALKDLAIEGHWYTCPNGHYYVVGDCGGTVMESRCADCGASVGGTQHRLREDNDRAHGLLDTARAVMARVAQAQPRQLEE
ncbi:hypothetical protein BC828DRAFT_356939 [Blastocladiella britannica]|nr:hypothetical protein BC828DRAFT_356939 [Blastocladiella britannica]